MKKEITKKIKILEKNKLCKNCQRYVNGQSYCSKCYPFMLRIKKVNNCEYPTWLEYYVKPFSVYDSEKRNKCINSMVLEYIRQIENRLSVIKDSNLLLSDVSEHDLEYKINGTLRYLDNKSLGKKNDELRSHLESKERAYIYKLFSEIYLLKPFRVNFNDILMARRKVK